MTTRHIIVRSVVAAFALTTSVPFLAIAVEFDVGKTRVIIGGYAKLDLIYNDASNVDLRGKNWLSGQTSIYRLRFRWTATG